MGAQVYINVEGHFNRSKNVFVFKYISDLLKKFLAVSEFKCRLFFKTKFLKKLQTDISLPVKEAPGVSGPIQSLINKLTYVKCVIERAQAMVRPDPKIK